MSTPESAPSAAAENLAGEQDHQEQTIVRGDIRKLLNDYGTEALNIPPGELAKAAQDAAKHLELSGNPVRPADDASEELKQQYQEDKQLYLLAKDIEEKSAALTE